MAQNFQTAKRIALATVLFSCRFAFAENPIQIQKQGFFASGGTMTEPLPGEYDFKTNWLSKTREGNTAHVDHASTFFQIPAKGKANPVVFLHGYGQSRIGWLTTPDGREGWSTMALRNGRAVFLVDMPHTGEAGRTPIVGSEEYKKFLNAKIPMLVIFGDYIGDRGPSEIKSSEFWKIIRDQALDFAEHYRADGGDAEVWDLPKMGITGNSHFMFQEKNNAELWQLIEKWLKAHKL